MSTTAKRFLASILGGVVTSTMLVGCSTQGENDELTVLASTIPHQEILRWIDEEHDDIQLDIKNISAGPETNLAVADGSADINFFQHEPYLLEWEAQTNKDLINVGGVHIEPMAMYSNSVSSIDELPDGARIAVPRSASDSARALLLLDSNGVVELDGSLEPGAISSITSASIVSNPKSVELVPIEDAITIQAMSDPEIDAVIASSNYALEAGYDPVDDAVITESPEGNPYTNIVVASPETADEPRVKTLVDALQSPETAAWITEQYGNAVIPTNG